MKKLPQEPPEDGNAVPEIIALVVVANELHLVDGQHRLEAFLWTKTPIDGVDTDGATP